MMNPPTDDRIVTTDPGQNPDPITGAPGSHPVGTALGSASGAAAGAAMGAVLGPVGFLVGGTIGAVAGAAAGHAIAENIDPTEEADYWRTHHVNRPYVDPEHSFETDYLPAFMFGVNKGNQQRGRDWDPAIEQELNSEWDQHRADSRLDWQRAQPAIRDAYDRTLATHATTDAADRYFASRFADASYRQGEYSFEHYRNAYRLGTFMRSRQPDRPWNNELEAQLEPRWAQVKGDSPLTWEQAMPATRDAWENIDRVRGHGATEKG